MQNKNTVRIVQMQRNGGHDSGRILFSRVWQDDTHEYKCVKIKDIDQNYELKKHLYRQRRLETPQLAELGLTSKWNFLYPFGSDFEFVVQRVRTSQKCE